MENEFIALRQRAREKRDKIMAQARADYEAALVQIATLEQGLTGIRPKRDRSAASCIESVIPREATFSTVEILAALEALDPGRIWNKRTVDNHLSKLRAVGLVRRLKRANLQERAIYVRSDSANHGGPLGDKTLIDVIGMVLTRPMNPTEIVVAVREAGYKSLMTGKMLRNHVGRELKRGGFKRVGRKWAKG